MLKELKTVGLFCSAALVFGAAHSAVASGVIIIQNGICCFEQTCGSQVKDYCDRACAKDEACSGDGGCDSSGNPYGWATCVHVN